MIKTVIVIPARMHSTRLPEKALADIAGKSLIQRVYEQALRCECAHDVIVATDHVLIFSHLQDLGYNVVMTSPDHSSGTERVAEAAAGIEADVIINVQGDEPMIDPAQIDDLSRVFEDEKVSIATQMSIVKQEADVFDYSKVKVVTDIHHRALYFSRQAIPAHRDLPYRDWPSHSVYFKHVGLYAFRKNTLLEITQLPTGLLEKAESLEQLRWLENGYTVHCFPTEYESIGVDTPEDLEKVRTVFRMMHDL